MNNHFFNIVILAWISSRYKYWDQSSFSLTHIETYMDQHQYGQANSWFLKSSSFWLDTQYSLQSLSSYFNHCKVIYQIFIHTSKLMWRSIYIQYESCPLSFDLCLLFPHLYIFDSFFNPWSKIVHYQTLLVHEKQAIVETNPRTSTHVSFAICQICLLSHDAMISYNIEAIP